MAVSITLRYTIDEGSKVLALVSPDGSVRTIAAISLDSTRQMPAEDAWRSLLGCAIEAAAESSS